MFIRFLFQRKYTFIWCEWFKSTSVWYIDICYQSEYYFIKRNNEIQENYTWQLYSFIVYECEACLVLNEIPTLLSISSICELNEYSFDDLLFVYFNNITITVMMTESSSFLLRTFNTLISDRISNVLLIII